jgi:N-acetylneuraminate synthase
MTMNAPYFQGPTRILGDKLVGFGQPVFITGEVGINHNGELANAFALIDQAAAAGCDAVKFQKRTPDVCTPRDQWNVERDTPWGRMSYIDYRHRVEFDEDDYRAIDAHARLRGIVWFASPWDVGSVDFLERFDVPAYKVASASLTDDDLLRRLRATSRTIILSTGMSTPKQIRHAVEVLGSDNIVLLHATSTYPAKPTELNLKMIHTPAVGVPQRADRLLRTRNRPADDTRRSGPWGGVRGAAHHPRPGPVGLGPGRFGGASRAAAAGP